MNAPRALKRLPSQRDRFAPLMVALFFMMLAYPYVPDGELGALLGGLLAMTGVLTGVYALRGHSFAYPVSGGLAVLALGCHCLDFIEPEMAPIWCTELLYGLFYLFVTVMVMHEVLMSARLTAGTIAGAISGYLLVGFTFAQIYDLIETVNPGSFHVGNPIQAQAGWQTLVFFSFMTLTTVGYGDITPATTQTQSLAMVEGSIGVLYVAIFIAAMVGLTVGRDRS
ncbi:MAG: potassium channel family protein [Bradymonadia bacterium]